jgi:D-inositol-3-phosphate glycosyltransferase
VKKKQKSSSASVTALGPVAHIMTSVSRGGLELYVRELIVKLHAANVQQVVVCDQHSFIQGDLKDLGISVEFLAAGSRYNPWRMWRLHAIQRAHRIQVWHSHQRDDMILVALAFFFSKSVRHIFSLYMGFARKKDLLHRLVYRRVEKLVTTSELMNSLARERLPVRASQIARIRYGRDHNAFALAPAKVKAIRKAVGATAGQKIVVSLCRLDPMKGVREFAEAARLLDYRMRGKFLFVQIGERTITSFDGEGRPVFLPESESVYRELLAAERGAQSTRYFRLLPFQKDYVPYLLASDYFVLGSYDEMYSLSMIDAMMAGCFVIGTNNGGTVEQLQDKRGFLIEAKSGAAIADALIRADKSAPQRKAMQKAAQSWVMQEHTWKAVLPQWLALYAHRQR